MTVEEKNAIEHNMTFSSALDAVKRGFVAARAGWNGKGMFVFLVPGSKFTVNRQPLSDMYPPGTDITYHSHIDMRTADGSITPWLASQTDILAEDWFVMGKHAVCGYEAFGIDTNRTVGAAGQVA